VIGYQRTPGVAPSYPKTGGTRHYRFVWPGAAPNFRKHMIQCWSSGSSACTTDTAAPLFPHADPEEPIERPGPQSLAFNFNDWDWAQIFEELKRVYGV
jgi:hypothetical protein